MRRFLVGATVSVAVLLAATMLIVRVAGSDPAVWHVDPLAAQRTGKPNDYLVMPEGLATALADQVDAPRPVSAEELMRRLDAIALASPRTERLAGSPSELFATYVERSAVFGFPDYMSVRAVETGGGAALAIWSRSRFGQSDLGVNKARVERWLAALDREG